MKSHFNLVALGGTFDRLHEGHKSLFHTAFTISSSAIIGLTVDSFIKEKTYATEVQPYLLREKIIREHLTQNFPSSVYQIVPLVDVYGPTLENRSIEALVVGPKTVAGARRINATRKSLGLVRLPVIVADSVRSRDGRYLSSTRIRQGEINRAGFIYQSWMDHSIRVDEKFKDYLRQKHGVRIKNIAHYLELLKKEQPVKVTWVGDQVGEFFSSHSLSYDLGVFDLQTRRFPNAHFQFLAKDSPRVKNLAGEVSLSMVQKIKWALNKGMTNLYVIGEEDLAVIPLILLLPLNSFICYGLFDQGMFLIKVTEEKKEELITKLSR